MIENHSIFTRFLYKISENFRKKTKSKIRFDSSIKNLMKDPKNTTEYVYHSRCSRVKKKKWYIINQNLTHFEVKSSKINDFLRIWCGSTPILSGGDRACFTGHRDAANRLRVLVFVIYHIVSEGFGRCFCWTCHNFCSRRSYDSWLVWPGGGIFHGF